MEGNNTQVMDGAGVPPLGQLFREWRGVRRMSQLDLALAAGSSARHVSFIETGCAQPSRNMVARLAEALEVPLRERNALFVAAGFAPLYRDSGLDTEALASARRALDSMLAKQEPYPALVMNRRWQIVMANQAATRSLTLLGGLAAPGDPAVTALIEEMLSYPGVPRDWRKPGLVPELPVVPVTLARGPLRMAWFTTIATFGTAQDVGLHELRIECSSPPTKPPSVPLTTSPSRRPDPRSQLERRHVR